jgi:hypothetical protein
VQVFVYNGDKFESAGTIDPPICNGGGQFGFGVAMSGDLALIYGPLDTYNSMGLMLYSYQG